MRGPIRRGWRLALILNGAFLLPMLAAAHPGSGIAVDRHGQVYLLDTGAGVWKIDARGTLTRVPGPAFHWMTIDANGRFGSVRLPSGPDWEITRSGADPTLLLASDFPIAIGQDGNLYYPTFGPGNGLDVLRFSPSGETSVLARLPSPTAGEPLRWINGLAAGPEGFLYYTENNAIRKISPRGRVSTVVADISLSGCPSIPGNAAGDPLLRGLAVDSRGTVHVAASGCGRVLKVTSDGKVTTVVQLQSPWSPTAVALSGGDVYVLEYVHTETEDRRAWRPRVRKISPTGKSAILASIDRR